MTEIVPTAPAAQATGLPASLPTNLSANQTLQLPILALPADGTPPSVLPVQIIALPPATDAPTESTMLDGSLQLLLNGKANFVTANGIYSLNLPQLRSNPALFDAIKTYLSDNPLLQLQLKPGTGGSMVDAQLLFSPHPQGTRSPPTLLAALTGQTIQAVILPSAPNNTNPTNPTSGQPATPPAATGSPAPAQETLAHFLTSTPLPPQNIPTKLDQILRRFLPTAPSANTAILSAQQQSASPQATLSPQSATQQLIPNATQPFINLKLQQIIPAGQTVPQIKLDELLLTVPAQNNPALPVVQSGSTNLLLKTNAHLPEGSMLLVKVQSNNIASGLEATSEQFATTTAWPVLQELLSTTSASTTPALQQFVQHRLPQGNAALSGALLFVMAAMQSGDIHQWVGQSAARVLDHNNQRLLLDNLQNEMQRNTSNTSDPIIGDWRVYHVPLLDQNQIQPLHIYVHHNHPQQDNAQQGQADDTVSQKKQTRFVIDVTFTRLGQMQLDGFVQPKQFDLMFRSQKHLSPTLRAELRTAFTAALEATGYQGQLIFQPGGQNWLHLSPTTHDIRRI